MLEALKAADLRITLFLNGLHAPWLDEAMAHLTQLETWLPFFALLAGYLLWRLRKQALPLFAVCALVVLATDQLASGLLKPLAERLRPCHDPAVQTFLHTVDGICGGKFGFASSHASNSAGIALYLGVSVREKTKWLLPVLLLWAFVNTYTRIYLGVHYVGDVLAGWAIGAVGGLLGVRLFRLANARLFRT